MSTKPIAESGWTKQFPTTDGDYLCRINEDDLSPVSFRLENGAIYEYGCGKNLRSDYYHHAAGYEFLGPFTASDFEQLIQLRKALPDLVERFEREYRDLTDGQYGTVEDFPEVKAIRKTLGKNNV